MACGDQSDGPTPLLHTPDYTLPTNVQIRAAVDLFCVIGQLAMSCSSTVALVEDGAPRVRSHTCAR